MPVFGVPERSYAHGGVAARPHVGPPIGPGRQPIVTAFVLGGGGNRGAVQVGMLRALTERGIRPDLLVGTSIGAINAAAFAGTPTLEGVHLAADLWQRIGRADIFPRGRLHGSWRYLERRASVYATSGLRAILGGLLRFERLEDSPIPLVVVATRLEDGVEEWLSEGPALEAILASAALPGLYPVVELSGAHYFDGGVLDNVPITAALSAGATKIFVLLCGTVEPSAGAFSRPYEAMFAAFSLALNARLRRDLAAIPPGVDVVLFEPPGRAGFDPQDFSQTEQLIERGYETARDVLDDYRDQMATHGRPATRWSARTWRARRVQAQPGARSGAPSRRPRSLARPEPGGSPRGSEPTGLRPDGPQPDGGSGSDAGGAGGATGGAGSGAGGAGGATT